MSSVRSIVDEVLTQQVTRELWTGNCRAVLPLSTQGFDVSAALPAMFYMFRFGRRRGKGKFTERFSTKGNKPREQRREATIERIAKELSADETEFAGFSGEPERAILADFLLSFCFENISNKLGRDKQVQRVAPTHFFSSWIDLPESVVHLRYVPELLVALLADQEGEFVLPSAKSESKFGVAGVIQENALLGPFSQGVVQADDLGNISGDKFCEKTKVALDQLMMVRIASKVGSAPTQARGRERAGQIPNHRPIAQRATRQFGADLSRFIETYGQCIPRPTYVSLLESGISVGLTSVVVSTIDTMLNWASTGNISDIEEGEFGLFVDCTNGMDRNLRAMSEQSVSDWMRRIEQFPIVLMAVRLLECWTEEFPEMVETDNFEGYAINRLNSLGDIMHKRVPGDCKGDLEYVFRDLEVRARKLARALRETHPEAAETLLRELDSEGTNVVWTLSEMLVTLMGRDATQSRLIRLIDSVLHIGRPNGLAVKRSVVRQHSGTGRRVRKEVRSLVLTDAVLDFLVHLLLEQRGPEGELNKLSFRDFVRALRHRFGLWVDEAPPGMSISSEIRTKNLRALEKRLRDLGLLLGVNDSERMKTLRARFRRHGH